MILIDTSVWADHFRKSDADLVGLLGAGRVLMHPFVTGELALGNLREPEKTVAMMRMLPRAKVASEAELLTFVTNEKLAGTGLGFVDAHLLAACRLTQGAQIWSRDKRLAAQASLLRLKWLPD